MVNHDAKFTSEVFSALVKSRMGSCRSAYRKSTNAKVERANGVISDTLRAYANGSNLAARTTGTLPGTVISR